MAYLLNPSQQRREVPKSLSPGIGSRDSTDVGATGFEPAVPPFVRLPDG